MYGYCYSSKRAEYLFHKCKETLGTVPIKLHTLFFFPFGTCLKNPYTKLQKKNYVWQRLTESSFVYLEFAYQNIIFIM